MTASYKDSFLNQQERDARTWKPLRVITSYSIHYTKLYECTEALLDPVVRQRLLATRDHRHALAINRVAADRCINAATRSQHRLHHGQVFTLYPACLQGVDQGLVP